MMKKDYDIIEHYRQIITQLDKNINHTWEIKWLRSTDTLAPISIV